MKEVGLPAAFDLLLYKYRDLKDSLANVANTWKELVGQNIHAGQGKKWMDATWMDGWMDGWMDEKKYGGSVNAGWKAQKSMPGCLPQAGWTWNC